MLFSKPGKPDSLKKAAYLLSATILGVLLSLIAQVLIEVNFLCSALNQGQVLYFNGSCVFPPMVQVVFYVLGAVAGFFFGDLCWRKVYIERVWEKKK
ncbi:MAG: hypothetical protein WC349_03335 [Patescibacteria group bacterium]|jgi:hypothetical protein